MDQGPRRSGLVQERSRRTRRALVDAALTLWTERGFDDGIEETTVEEIAHAAGVTKGTFYFHFAHKEDILLEIGWGTSEAMFKDATKYVADELPVEEALDKLLDTLARRITSSPRAAVARTMAEFYRRPTGRVEGGTHFGFERSFSTLFLWAQETRQVPSELDARAIAEMLFSLTMGAISEWTLDETNDLAEDLRSRAALLVAGVRGLAAVTRSA